MHRSLVIGYVSTRERRRQLAKLLRPPRQRGMCRRREPVHLGWPRFATPCSRVRSPAGSLTSLQH
jgi:hypothetical protein